MGSKQPALAQPLQQKLGVMLFSALDTKGDGQVGRATLKATLEAAVANDPQLLDEFVDVYGAVSAT